MITQPSNSNHFTTHLFFLTYSHCMVEHNAQKSRLPHSGSYTNMQHPLPSETPHTRENDGLLSRLKELEQNLANVGDAPSYGWRKSLPPQYYRHPRTSGVDNFNTGETPLSQDASAHQKQQRRLRLDQFVQSAKRNAAKRSMSRGILMKDRDHPYMSSRRTNRDL